jgi:RimJ/RimL family protein N-acetyltransferase
MEFMPSPLTREESTIRLEVYTKHIQNHGWGLWAVSAVGVSDFIGWIGLWTIGFDAHFTPAIEVGWRLLPEFWGQGYATEGAKASIQYGFDILQLDEIVSITVPANLRSRRVIEKLGMHRDPKDDFDHPKLPEGHPLRRHVLYRLQRSESENVEKIKSLALCPSHLIGPAVKTLIRPMNALDIAKIVSRYSFSWSTPEKTKVLWDTYYREQQDNIRTVAVLEKDNEILGYGSLLRKPESPFFVDKKVPEINAIWIDEDYRRQGLGTALIKWLEKLASQEGYQQIGIGVGLYRDYGPAQKLYFQLGYVPDGNGITYKGQPTVPGQTYPLDDDLILWLMKELRIKEFHG